MDPRKKKELERQQKLLEGLPTPKEGYWATNPTSSRSRGGAKSTRVRTPSVKLRNIGTTEVKKEQILTKVASNRVVKPKTNVPSIRNIQNIPSIRNVTVNYTIVYKS
jgi:hypothetical protein